MDITNYKKILLDSKPFNPLLDNPKELPNVAGIYIICVNSIEVLPKNMKNLKYDLLNGKPIIYTGISKKSLRTRDFKYHFNGTARRSTLRKSLGVLFDLEKKELDKGKYKFIENHENWLSLWMKENLLLYWFTPQINNTELESLEKELINLINPPLNIKSNYNEENKSFRKTLSTLRKLQN
ncbi:GIY-YIG nuclease family protein [Metabacillus malikii]|uniref:GIY-YIG catalytic domain-containing protein n=1 Tax=Metabacillus malikii TaxID=1504265 RepID=A0ABT9ZHM7_9BACI|nr:hypothetical protein [Metabacillus malikii]MDQ0231791.1 hypothetical protein [Metabacillus malikii]